MRLRNITGSREFIAENEFVVHEPEQYKGRWHELFGNKNPIHIEIGMGKGQFITTLAQQNPNVNYIGIEKYSSVLLRAVEKQKELELKNRAQNVKEDELKLAQEKFAAAERRENAAKAAVSDNRLSDTERMARLKEIYGL